MLLSYRYSNLSIMKILMPLSQLMPLHVTRIIFIVIVIVLIKMATMTSHNDATINVCDFQATGTSHSNIELASIDVHCACHVNNTSRRAHKFNNCHWTRNCRNDNSITSMDSAYLKK